MVKTNLKNNPVKGPFGLSKRNTNILIALLAVGVIATFVFILSSGKDKTEPPTIAQTRLAAQTDEAVEYSSAPTTVEHKPILMGGDIYRSSNVKIEFNESAEEPASGEVSDENPEPTPPQPAGSSM